MKVASEYTPNYNLDLYASTDKPNLRDQYNAAMGKIDTQLKQNADGVTNANANVGTLQTQMNTANGNIETLQTTVAEHTTQIETASDNASEALATANQNKSDISTLENTVDGHDQKITQLISTTEQQQIQIGGKAPKNHQSANATYGAASASMYGHVKLTDNMSSKDDVSDGVAATPMMVNDLVDSVKSYINAMINMTDSVSLTAADVTLFTASGDTGNPAPWDNSLTRVSTGIDGNSIATTFMFNAANPVCFRIIGWCAINWTGTIAPPNRKYYDRFPLTKLGALGTKLAGLGRRSFTHLGIGGSRSNDGAGATSVFPCSFYSDGTYGYIYMEIGYQSPSAFTGYSWIQTPIFLDSEPFPDVVMPDGQEV